MPKKNNKEYRTFLSLGEVGHKLDNNANTDPRFKTRSSYARHLLELGFKADAKARKKAIEQVDA